jgi:glutathione S-transferase
MITVHHLGISQSERIVWLCEELELPYQLVLYDRDSATRRSPDKYKALHPLETAPTITDGDLVLAESGAIIDYIIAKHGGGRLALAPDDPNFADYLFWFHFANGSMMPRQMIASLARRLDATQNNAKHWAVTRADQSFEMVERRLSHATYFAGDRFTAADIMMFFSLTTFRVFAPRDYSTCPSIRAYIKRIAERSAYKRAMEKGDPNLQGHLD